ncbi:hypothetical protein roselon_03535 [Roseibacterium elongatum DSM 19469]|uniref:Uncharacterized protein n=1 Tax=Roseicyclus elongatus DSM 19469 TaxID=1294273 RepID=W8RX47_9RHOB|nr:hypothetical protein roselon_03535 [Roseibacterium elongatum DSM 19469]
MRAQYGRGNSPGCGSSLMVGGGDGIGHKAQNAQQLAPARAA